MTLSEPSTNEPIKAIIVMSNYDIVKGILATGKSAYLKDSFLRAAIRMDPKGRRFYKNSGENEFEVSRDHETFYEIFLGGETITESEYENF